jgi:hypothetical protein
MMPWNRMGKKAKILTYGLLGAAALGYGVLWFEYKTKRQDYPERDVLFRGEETTWFKGSHEGRDIAFADKESKIEVKLGGTSSTRVGNIYATYEFTYREKGLDFTAINSENKKFVNTTHRPEKVLDNASLSGGNTFIEEGTVLGISEDVNKDPDVITYTLIPERGFRHIELTVLRNPDGSKTLVNKVVDERGLLGWATDIRYRAGTYLEQFEVRTPEDEKKTLELFKTINEYDNSKNKASTTSRQEIQRKIFQIADSISTKRIYHSNEDGFLDWLPQESTMYVYTGNGPKDYVKLRVENHWDLWPGNLKYIPGLGHALAKLPIGFGRDQLKPFDHINNGGYTIEDSTGIIARIDIEDFIRPYGYDLIYHYFVDKNGDGKIDKDTECIGRVLYKAVQDERIDELEKNVGKNRDKVDVTYDWHYAFMAGSDLTPEGSMKDFHLGAYVETVMPNEVNRGFDKHSHIGWINRLRGAIMLRQEPTKYNLTRTLNQEGTIEAAHDIVNLFKAARRPYVSAVESYHAEKVGITVSADLSHIIK